METDGDTLVVFSLDDIGVLGGLMGYAKSCIENGDYNPEYRKDLELMFDTLNSKMNDVFSGSDALTNEVRSLLPEVDKDE